MKKLFKTAISLLLTLVMVLGMVPATVLAADGCSHEKTSETLVSNGNGTHTTVTVCDDCGEKILPETNNETASITVDFRAFVQEAAKQDWWDDLRAANSESVKFIGRINNNDSAAVFKEPYAAMREYLEENECWNIDDSRSLFGSHIKRLYLCADSSVPWAISFATYYQGGANADRGRLAFTVEAEKEGWYDLSLDMFREWSSYTTRQSLCLSSDYAGGGTVDVFVNDEQVYDGLSFADKSNSRTTQTICKVYLNEGDNSVMLQAKHSYNGPATVSGGRFNIALNSMVFTMAPQPMLQAGESVTLDPNAYVVFGDEEITAMNYTVRSTDETVATVAFDANNDLAITAVKNGIATVVVEKNNKEICSILVTVGDGVTEHCVDEEENGICDLCEAVCGECKHRKTSKTVVSNGDDTSTYTVTCDYCGATVLQYIRHDHDIVLDFKDFAKDISSKAWWDDLVPAAEPGTKYIGCRSNNVAMTAAQTAAYDSMMAYLDENYQWNIDEEISGFKKPNFWKCLFFNGADDVPWGISYFPLYHASQPERANLAFTIKVDEGKAGWYHLDLSVFKENTGANTANYTGQSAGAGWVDVFVNGDLVLADYEMRGAQISATDSMGAVYLHEGDNSLVIYSKLSYNETDYIGRCNLNFDSIHFSPLRPVKVKEHLTEKVVLNDTYLPYNEDTTGYTVVSSDDWIATAELTPAGVVIITGASEGEAEITVYDGEEVVCTIPVNVQIFDGTMDDLQGTPVKVDFMTVMDRATEQSWWNGMTETDEADVKKLTMEDASMLDWLDRNAKWNFTAIDGALAANGGSAKYGFGLDGTATVTLDVPAAGLYNVAVEYLAGGASVQMAVNGTAFYKAVSTAGTPAVVNCSLGTVELSKGENTFTFTSQNGEVYLRALTITPMGLWQAEVGRNRYINLNETYFPYDLSLEGFTVNSDDAAVATAKIDADGDLIVIGVSEGQTVIRVQGTGGYSAAVRVNVVENGTFSELTYTIDGFKAETLNLGEVAIGALSGLTSEKTPLTDKQLRLEGDVYFTSSDPDVAAVDQATGNVTCLAEGTSVITAYAKFNGIKISTFVTLTVSDDTDLESIDLISYADPITVGRTVQLTAEGRKASGAKANMDNFTVTYTLDPEAEALGIAAITPDGMLTACKEGTVTVTATAGVAKMPVTDTLTIEIVSDQEVTKSDVFFDFTLGKVTYLKTATLEKDGIAIDFENSYKQGAKLLYNSKMGLTASSQELGDRLYIDVVIPRSGWYTMELWGGGFSYGGTAETYLDDMYMGSTAFLTSTYDMKSVMNTAWLDAGVHRIAMECVKTGGWYIGRIAFTATTDPNEMQIELACKDEMLVGESVNAEVKIDTANNYGNYTLKNVASAPDFTNYYTLTSSDPSVVSVSGSTLKAMAGGNATITMTGEAGGKAVTCSVDIAVTEGTVASISARLDEHTVRPSVKSTFITVVGYDMNGAELSALPADVTVEYACEDTDIASVDAQGNVTMTGNIGSAEIIVTVTEKGRVQTDTVWLTVTEGKTEPTLYTYEERANAQENVLKYSWAWRTKEAVVRTADYVVENLDTFYELYPYFFTEARASIGTRTDTMKYVCRYCKADISKFSSIYGWIVDPINNPWKITCPVCRRDFPSNDFGAYYESGLDERGWFREELANKDLLVNELYPEMGAGWGVDDGQGYTSGDELHNYIQYYVHCLIQALGESKYSFQDVIAALRDAYLYTGDEKYGNAGAILIDRWADIYDTYQYLYDWDKGKAIGCIWEANGLQPVLCTAADAFWPCQANDEVIEYLRGKAWTKGIDPEQIDTEYLRANVEDGILLVVKRTCETKESSGNFGMHQSAMAYAAVCLDRLPESEEMIDWIFRSSTTYMEPNGEYEILLTGADTMDKIINLVDRNGFGNEGSNAYNRLWYRNLTELANALDGYTRVEGADLWQNPKFINMFAAMGKIISMGTCTYQSGENGSVQSMGVLLTVEDLTTAFMKTGDAEIGKALYFTNGRSTNGLHADIFTKDPESGMKADIQNIIDNEGEMNWSQSNMLTGHGVAMLRNGPDQLVKGKNEAEFCDFAIYFGQNGGTHGATEALNLQIGAFGIPVCPTPGYPNNVNEQDPQRMQWVKNTVSHNTVVVDDRQQSVYPNSAYPLHFDDAGNVQLMDISAPGAYPQTEVYRRTLVTVNNGDGVYYAVDFFRVLGGKEHVYAFHAASMEDPATTGLDMIEQPFGTYESVDVELGHYQRNPDSNDAAVNAGSGYNWLYDVSRDADPDAVYSVDFACEDFNNVLVDNTGVHLKLTMLSEEPLAEVALANGYSIQKKGNPEYMEFLLARNSGTNDLDSLFTSVIEPYKYNSYIAASELVDVELQEGAEGRTDRAAAIKVTLKSGREDYIVYATNPDCTYLVDNKITFRGFAGVFSYEGGKLTYAYGNEVSSMADEQIGVLEENMVASVTGTITDFTKELARHYNMTVELDTPVAAEELIDRYIYVNNDGAENGVYRIYDAQVNGSTAVLDLDTQDFIRSYADSTNLDAGFIYNIEEGQTFSIPMSTVVDKLSYLNYQADTVVKAGTKLSLTTGVADSGCTYTAEGLPSGAKLDAKTGTITWTTSRTQVGRYPVTVKAVDADGTVLGAMSFNIYVVSYTGSAYDASVCTHAKAVTYTVDNVIETVCPACGTVTKTVIEDEPAVEKFDVAGANMTLGNELKLNVLVKNEVLGDGTYTAKITHGDTTVEQTLAKYSTTYSAVSYTLAAAQMADTITVEIFDEDGNAVSNVYETSVRTYAMKLLERSTTNAKTKTLLVDMLNYGAAAQTHFSYNTEDLANSLLSDAQKALATETVTCADNRVKGENYYGSNLSLEGKILLNLIFKNVTEGMYAEISFTDFEGTAQTIEVPYEEFEAYGKSYHKVVVDDIALAEAFSLVTVTVYNADGTVHGTASDSVESYVARAAQSDLNDAIMKFAASAKAYYS